MPGFMSNETSNELFNRKCRENEERIKRRIREERERDEKRDMELMNKYYNDPIDKESDSKIRDLENKVRFLESENKALQDLISCKDKLIDVYESINKTNNK